MLSIALVSFRELLEIILMVALILAVLPERLTFRKKRIIYSGTAIGIAGAALVAIFLSQIGDFANGYGQEILNALLLLAVASLMLWTVYTIPTMQKQFKEQLGQIKEDCNGTTPNCCSKRLVWLIAAIMWRELGELTLFTYASITSGKLNWLEVVAGIIFGMLAAIVTGTVLFHALTRSQRRILFRSMNIAVVIIAASLVSEAIELLTAAELIPSFAPIRLAIIPISMSPLSSGVYFVVLLAAALGYYWHKHNSLRKPT